MFFAWADACTGSSTVNRCADAAIGTTIVTLQQLDARLDGFSVVESDDVFERSRNQLQGGDWEKRIEKRTVRHREGSR